MKKLVSVALTPDEKKKQKKLYSGPGSVESYPWGSRLELDDDLLAKLKVNPKDFTVGDGITGSFLAKVVDLAQRERGGKPISSMTLQITKLGLEADPGEELEKGIKKGLKE